MAKLEDAFTRASTRVKENFLGMGTRCKDLTSFRLKKQLSPFLFPLPRLLANPSLKPSRVPRVFPNNFVPFET
jgi:hypothetical protein